MVAARPAKATCVRTLRRINSTRAASRMSAISKLRALIANGKSGAMRPTKRGHVFKLLWDLEVAQCEYVAAMGGFSEAVKRCSAIGPSDTDTLQNLKFATSIQARALATYNRAVDQVLKL